MDAFIKGLLAGIPIALSFGPGFLLLFQASLNHGHRTGLLILSGIVAGDILLIFLGYYGLGQFLAGLDGLYLGFAAAAILCAFGVTALSKKQSVTPIPTGGGRSLPQLSSSKALLKGLAINMTNPFNFIFWMGVITVAASTFGGGSNRFYAFFAGLGLMTIGADMLKIFLSGWLRNILKPRLLLIVNKLVGVLFLVAGGYILVRVL